MATTTPNYGWSVPTSSDYVAQGAVAIETLGDSVDATLYTALGGAYPGLRLIKKQTIGSGVSTVELTSVFSATYEAYKVVMVGGTTSLPEAISIQFGPTSVSQYNSQYYQNLIYAGIGGGSPATVFTANASSFPFCVYSEQANGYAATFDLFSPFANKYATTSGSRTGINAGSNVGNHNGFHNSTNSFTSLRLLTSGTMTGGTVYVYGYGAS